ncbi:MAG: hypothetical protein O2931_13885 [Planctomycetota bacterium]|nr:hypothetical protein [Planctomycetota bacterium]MDA1179875.1 hypothetical protein [Planctomycetota bacterium]
MIALYRIAKDTAGITLQPFGEDAVDCGEIGGLVGNQRFRITTIQN